MIDSQIYIIDSLSLDVLLELNANLVVAWLYHPLKTFTHIVYVNFKAKQSKANLSILNTLAMFSIL